MPSLIVGGPSHQRADTWFATTHWSVILGAKDGNSGKTVEAMEKLCRTYWPPLFVYIRRAGYNEFDAKDLTQAFFLHLMRQDFLGHLQHQRGKFRSFLLTFLKHFLSDERDKAQALKRGGDCGLVALDALEPDAQNALIPPDSRTPEGAYERHWARTILERALFRLRAEYASNGKADLFDQLKDFEPGKHGPVTYAEAGARLGLSESGVKSAVHRLRRRHREILRAEVAETVASPEDVDEEIRHLIRVLGG